MTLLDPDNRLWLDYIDFMPATATDTAGTTSTTPSTATSNKKYISKGVVAGISISAAILFSVSVLGLLWWLRRKHRRRHSSEVDQAELSLTDPDVDVSQQRYSYPSSTISSSIPPISSDSSAPGLGKAVYTYRIQNH
ncbi:hypothetical protein V5O48_007771 [Marasmius crinis-equi]|uniref:Mid2 domain-containing protein n=1 Tax=Marasmius crinis-equi TaxID=585013 RepID=A0ABR3FGC7_9AGAR